MNSTYTAKSTANQYTAQERERRWGRHAMTTATYLVVRLHHPSAVLAHALDRSEYVHLQPRTQ